MDLFHCGNSDFKKIKTGEIRTAIKLSRNDSAFGADGLPVYIIKKLQNFLIPILEKMFNSFSYHSCSKNLEISNHHAYFKKGADKNNISSYRPISVTNIFAEFSKRFY